MPAERAAVRSRLAVLRPAYLPPAAVLHRVSIARRRSCLAATLNRVEHRDERVVVETSRHRITGVLRLPRDGYRSRLTDYLNASDRSFMPLTEVEIGPLDGSTPSERRGFVAVSIEHIVLVSPAVREQTEA